MNTEDRLQERLTRLEAGEPLEACATDLSAEEVELLRTAAQLRSVEYPQREAARVARQRAGVLRAAQMHAKTSPNSSYYGYYKSNSRPAEKVRSFWSWLTATPKPAFALAAIAVAVIAVVALKPSASPPAQVADRPSTAVVPIAEATGLPFTQYVPVVSSVLRAPNAQSAVLSEARGIVETFTDGKWAPVQLGKVFQAGQRVRTGQLSGATLLFYDGSQARLGAASEVAIEELSAQTDGPRVIQLSQALGETDHQVIPSHYLSSYYTVVTPNGSGTATGTQFHVSVSPSSVTRVSVDEGAVAVTNQNVTVSVGAGQLTTVLNETPPAAPTFRVSGEGIVTQIGETWVIGGMEFSTDEETIIVGNPQVGDLVSVEGHLLADGGRMADTIELLRHAPENRFAFIGTVETISATQWIVSGRAVEVNGETEIEDGIEVGANVEVKGIVHSDGTLLAASIRLVEAGLPFEFTGLVESMGDTWLISGVTIAVDENTEIEDGIQVGDVVKVEGRILEDGTWLASEIKLAETDRGFEFTGVVQSIDPWLVSGIGFETDEQTQIEDGIEVGDRVKVEGRVLDDGTWLATEIDRLDDEDVRRFAFIGKVGGIDPWIIGGLPIATDEQTEIDAGIEIGDLVKVRGIILDDGTLLARRIRRIDSTRICTTIRAVVTSVTPDEITLSNGQTIPLAGVQVEGELKVGSTVIVKLCIDANGDLVVVSIKVVDESGSPTPTPVPPDDRQKVTICHIPPGNPDKAHTITVGASAVAGHLAHGDTLGPCSDDHDDGDKEKGKKSGDD